MSIFGQKFRVIFLGNIPFSGGDGVKFLVSPIKEPMIHLFRVENIGGSNWLGTKMCNFDPKIKILWAKSQLFVR